MGVTECRGVGEGGSKVGLLDGVADGGAGGDDSMAVELGSGDGGGHGGRWLEVSGVSGGYVGYVAHVGEGVALLRAGEGS